MRRRCIASCLGLTLVFVAACSAARAGEMPRRIVSINLCTDQYLLALAAPEQILALSPYARDARVSFFAERARPHRLVEDDAESVLALKPDIVFASIYNRPETLARLRRAGISVATLEEVGTLARIPDQIRSVGALLGRADAAEALATRFEAALAETAGRLRAANLRALYYERGGYTPGASGLAHDMLRHLGLRSAAEEAGMNAPGFLDIEAVLALRPDLLVMAEHGLAGDQGAAMLAHPALARLYAGERRLTLPVRETICAGPSAMAAVKRLAPPAP
jgi:iron complex transport system substrate-binding protein